MRLHALRRSNAGTKDPFAKSQTAAPSTAAVVSPAGTWPHRARNSFTEASGIVVTFAWLLALSWRKGSLQAACTNGIDGPCSVPVNLEENDVRLSSNFAAEAFRLERGP